MNLRIVFTFLFILLAASFSGQVCLDDDPVSLQLKHAENIEFIQIENHENVSRGTSKEQMPLYAGHTVELENEMMQKGTWLNTSSGWRIWQLGFVVPGAKGLNVYFENLELFPGDRLYIYSTDRAQILGALSTQNNDQFIGTAFLPGESIIVEYNTREKVNEVPFRISEIGISVKGMANGKRDFGDSGNCEVLVNCPEGEDFSDQRRSVTRILVKEGSSLFWCTGSLMNNTNRDATPYLLTAHHCGEDASVEDFSQWLFYFNFETDDCEFPVFEPEHQSLSGATLVADGRKTSTGSDFRLLLLQEDIPQSYNPYFNGWNRTTDASPNGVGIHHPDGDLKMVSTYTKPLVSTKYNNETPNEAGHFWKVYWSETESGHGVTEGGSSGSPIYDPDGYVVGTLSGGRASCSQLTQPDYYGKFSVHWDGNGFDSTSQLKPWLDPINSDAPALRGMDLDSSALRADFVSNMTEVKVGGQVRFYNKSQGDIQEFKWEFEGGNPEFAESETPPPVAYLKTGTYNVKLVVKSKNDSDSLAIENYIRVLPNLYPNPSSTGQFNIIFGEEIPGDVEFYVYSIEGQTIEFKSSVSSDNVVTIDIGNHPQGIYFIQVRTEGTVQTMKASSKMYFGLD